LLDRVYKKFKLSFEPELEAEFLYALRVQLADNSRFMSKLVFFTGLFLGVGLIAVGAGTMQSAGLLTLTVVCPAMLMSWWMSSKKIFIPVIEYAGLLLSLGLLFCFELVTAEIDPLFAKRPDFNHIALSVPLCWWGFVCVLLIHSFSYWHPLV